MEGRQMLAVGSAPQSEQERRLEEFIKNVLGNIGEPREIPEGPKLNLGCGRVKFPDFVNVDKNEKVKPDILCNLDGPGVRILLESDKYVFAIASHLIEHIRFLPEFMEGLYRVMAPDGLVFISCPYAWSNQAIEDPTHVRFINEHSMGYFDRRSGFRQDNGYDFNCDFKIENVGLGGTNDLLSAEDKYKQRFMTHQINFVIEVTFLLRAIKPMRDLP